MKHVYFYGGGESEAGAEQKDLLGGKGANLAEMVRIGVPVPPGFTITTEVCRLHLRESRYPEGLREEVGGAMRRLEEVSGKRFGARERPLLVSVRSGAAVSMPGMMETILNLGLNDETVEGLAAETGDEAFALDSYRRLVQMYGTTVRGIPEPEFARAADRFTRERRVDSPIALPPEDLRELIESHKRIVREKSGADFPTDPVDQLWDAIEAVFQSWENPRSRAYRRVNGIPDDLGTAVSVVAMVFGNLGDDSGTGVAFTRDPATGERKLFGEFLPQAQGEDVVAGIRDPLPIARMRERLPEAYRELEEVSKRLEAHYGDMQDLEFTVELGKLFLLQTRRAKRSAQAAVRVAVELQAEGVLSEADALRRVRPEHVEQLLHPSIDPDAEVEVLATGLAASPGAAAGHVVFNPEEAAERGSAGDPVVLVRRETSPEDFEGMVAARAVVTCRGGMTSHAAVVARGMGRCCVVGASEIEIDEAYGRFTANGRSVRHDDWITVDGSSGRVIAGQVPTRDAEPGDEFRRLMGWADERRRLAVRANADTPGDAARARSFGAQGIGLCRTEHMFFQDGRIDVVREMILADSRAARQSAIDRLLPMQREDFEGIFRAMDGLPVTIRLLDPPLHEFLPLGAAEIKALARKLRTDAATMRARVDRHHEANPMLGHRGVRLGITFPEITRMQARAIFEAAANVVADGVRPVPEIMVPVVMHAEELRRQRDLIDTVAGEVLVAARAEVHYTVGTMIELPRAALTADRIAEHADFFSFGTNDLTQTTMGLSRDDAGAFLPDYVREGILSGDPFQTLDVEGVGQLVRLATERGRSSTPGLKVGICGEHGGDPTSIEFFDRIGLDYVSCSPFRVPVARLAAAQATLGSTSRPDD